MKHIHSTEAIEFADPSLAEAYLQRMMTILQADIDFLLSRNPYLFLATAPVLAGDIITQALNTHIQIAQREFVDALLRHLVRSIGQRASDGGVQERSSGDLEFNNRHVLYAGIIETVHREIKACRDALAEQEARAHNRMLKQFLTRYCDERGAYDWNKFIARNSCNFDLNAFLSKS
jgi:hypothetical protein